nr:MAG TPA: HTH domain protein [Caudoviricetes sp.]DAL68732.1 MAG TPA: HTH domain protein [Caudoviricetes sp.]
MLLTLAESSPFWYNRFRKGRLPPWWLQVLVS